jgi:hypothetical protein
MTLIGGQDTGLGNVDTAGQVEGEGTGSIVEITSSDASVEVTNAFGPVVDLKVPGSVTPASAVTGLTFPIVAGVPTLTAGSPVVLPGELGVEGELFAEDGLQVTGDALVTGNAQIDGTTDFLGAVHAHTGAPVQVDDAFTSNTSASFSGTTDVNGTLNVSGTTGITGTASLNAEPVAVYLALDSINTSGNTLAGLSATALTVGATFAWVATVGAWFHLQTSALATTATTVVNASGLAGAQWLRMNWLNPVWQAQTAWTVNTSTGNDENAGTSGAPLLTVSEVARRLAFANLSATTVTLIGNMASTDKAVWTASYLDEFALTIVGTMTSLFSGTVTTAVNAAPAPTTTENDLTDTSIPTSFTASGLLANGVLVTFTSGTANGSSSWIAKDVGGKTARISAPKLPFAANVAFAVGDHYTAWQLPTVQQMRFVGNLTALSVFFSNVQFSSSIPQIDEQCFYFQACWFPAAIVAANVFENCAFQGAGAQQGAGDNSIGGPVWNGGMWRGSGATQFFVYASPGGSMNFTLTFQGVALVVNNGSFVTCQNNSFMVYDVTSTLGPLQVSYWSELLFFNSAVGGSNNVALATVSKMAQIAHTVTPLWLAGSSTATNPIFVSGTVGSPITVAAESAGAGVVNTQQNGVYATS